MSIRDQAGSFFREGENWQLVQISEPNPELNLNLFYMQGDIPSELEQFRRQTFTILTIVVRLLIRARASQQEQGGQDGSVLVNG